MTDRPQLGRRAHRRPRRGQASAVATPVERLPRHHPRPLRPVHDHRCALGRGRLGHGRRAVRARPSPSPSCGPTVRGRRRAAPPPPAPSLERRAALVRRRPGARRRGSRAHDRLTSPRPAYFGVMPESEQPDQRAGPSRRDRARTAGRPRAARIAQQQTWVDLQVRQAMERGDFDDLPGAGKPIADLGEHPRPGLVDQEAGRARARGRSCRRAWRCARRTPSSTTPWTR